MDRYLFSAALFAVVGALLIHPFTRSAAAQDTPQAAVCTMSRTGGGFVGNTRWTDGYTKNTASAIAAHQLAGRHAISMVPVQSAGTTFGVMVCGW